MLRFYTAEPAALLSNFKQLINQKEPKGRIDTWEEHGKGFRHTAADWKEKGLFEASIATDNKSLEFKTIELSEPYAFAYYHGHLLQAFVEHLGSRFSSAEYRDFREKK